MTKCPLVAGTKQSRWAGKAVGPKRQLIDVPAVAANILMRPLTVLTRPEAVFLVVCDPSISEL